MRVVRKYTPFGTVRPASSRPFQVSTWRPASSVPLCSVRTRRPARSSSATSALPPRDGITNDTFSSPPLYGSGHADSDRAVATPASWPAGRPPNCTLADTTLNEPLPPRAVYAITGAPERSSDSDVLRPVAPLASSTSTIHTPSCSCAYLSAPASASM